MQDEGLAQVEAILASTSLEALGPLGRAEVLTLIKTSPLYSIVPKTAAASTSTPSMSVGSLDPVWFNWGAKQR